MLIHVPQESKVTHKIAQAEGLEMRLIMLHLGATSQLMHYSYLHGAGGGNSESFQHTFFGMQCNSAVVAAKILL